MTCFAQWNVLKVMCVTSRQKPLKTGIHIIFFPSSCYDKWQHCRGKRLHQLVSLCEDDVEQISHQPKMDLQLEWKINVYDFKPVRFWSYLLLPYSTAQPYQFKIQNQSHYFFPCTLLTESNNIKASHLLSLLYSLFSLFLFEPSPSTHLTSLETWEHI